MAQIIQHPRAAAAPVIQQRRAGRHPRMVVNLWRYRWTKELEQSKVSINLLNIETTRSAIASAERAVQILRHDLAIALQNQERCQ